MVFHCLGPLVCKLKELGSINKDCERFLHCHSLLVAVGELQDKAAEAKWWEAYTLNCMGEVAVVFRTHMTLLCLKSVDIYLHLDNRLKRATPVFPNPSVVLL